LSTDSLTQKKKRSPLRRALNALMSDQDWQNIRKPVISAFIIFHCGLNLMYMFDYHPYQNSIVHMFWGYYHYLGLDQDFGVFAPIPRNQNPHLIALITYKDGSTKLWESPRIEWMDQLTRMQKERYRKFFDDNLAWPTYKLLWPDLTSYIARSNYDDPDNPPEKVTLFRYSSPVLPPEVGLHIKNGAHFNRELMQVSRVRPEDLK
jgi:hypothetical protein